MTTTLRRPEPVDQQDVASPPGPPPRAHQLFDDPTLLATLALTLVTVVVAIGFGRLFVNGSYIPAVLLTALGCHLTAWATRRWSLGPAGFLAGVAVPLAVIAWIVLPGTTFFGIPTPSTLSTAGHELSKAYDAFRHVVAPTPVTDGFVIAAVIGIAVSALLADAAAFTVRATFEAAIPSFTLFVFTATLGTARFRSVAIATYLGAVLVFLMLHQEALDSLSASWFASRVRGGRAGLLRTGALLGAVAVIAALLVGPHLPGAGAKAVIRLHGAEGEGRTTRTTVSPLVNIRTRLVDQQNVEVFTVESAARAYWRLTSLDRYDGEIWSSEGSYQKLGNSLDDSAPAPAGETVQQRYTVSRLSSIWLPAAYEPRHVTGVKGLSYNPDSASVISREPTSDGLIYEVESVIPHFTAHDLAGAPVGGLPTEAGRRYTAPPNVSARVRALALQVAGTGSPYARAKALQDFFRSGRFAYDLRVPPGHDGRALERFLFDVKRGYCEQFAGAYAVLARLVGLPTRVAVGFTTGEAGPDGVFHVRDLNAHAWPEVYLSGFGWVPFEPTPGRGAPGAQDYTGVAESQANASNPSTATTLGATATTQAPQQSQDTTPTTAAAAPTQPDRRQASPKHHPSRRPFVLTGLVMLLVAAWAVGVPGAKRLRRARRRAAAADAASRILVSWTEAGEALGAARVARRPAETMNEYATRATRAVPLVAETAGALATLADDAAEASYASGAPDETAVMRAEHAAAAVEDAVREQATTQQRVLRALDPRPLFSRRRA